MTTATTDQDFVDDVARGMSLRELSERYNVSVRGVSRRKLRLGLSSPNTPRAPLAPRKDRALALLAEGMIPSWVAEETGLGAGTVTTLAKSVDGHDANIAEWRSAWGAMRKHPELVALHNELKPKKEAA